MIRNLLPLGLLICCAIGLSSAANAENWPGWRGPTRNGLSSETDVPLRWTDEQGVKWKIPVPGSGISNPIIWGDRVIVTAADGPKQIELHVICFAVDDGRELWHQRLWGTAPTRYHANKSSMATPAPVTDGQHIFAFFGTGDVFCFDMEGRLQWQRSLAEEYGVFENRFAASSSPVVFKESVLLQCDHYGNSYVIALDKKTGENRWKVDRPEAWLSWASPQLVPVDADTSELVLAGSHKVDAFDPSTGEHLWTVGGMRRECIPTPVYGHGFIYAVSGPKGPTLAIRPGGRGDVSETHVQWQNNRGAPFVPSAILVGDHYYLIDDAGIATCLDAHSGKRMWQKRLSARFTASPVAAAGRVYFMSEEGETIVIDATAKKYRQLASNSLNEPTFASPAISQGRIFLRTSKHLYCIDGI